MEALIVRLGAALLAIVSLHAQSASGRITNSVTHEPVRKATVTLRLWGEAPESYVCESDAQGRFSIAHVPPGQYEFSVANERYLPSPAVLVTLPSNNLSRELVPLAVISGRVSDGMGRPVPAATVHAMRYEFDGKRELVPKAVAFTDDRGNYRLSRLAPGRWFLRAEKQSFEDSFEVRGPERVRSYVSAYYPGSTRLDRALALQAAPGTELPDIDMTLRREETFSLGVVAPPKAIVTVRAAGSADYQNRREVGSGQTASIHGLTPGDYYVQVAVEEENTLRPFLLSRLQVFDQDIVALDLRRPNAREISGVITGAKDIRSFILRPNEDEILDSVDVPVDEDGKFHAWVYLSEYEVSVPDNYYPKSITSGERQLHHHLNLTEPIGPLKIELANDFGRIEGIVTPADGPRPAHARVTLSSDSVYRSVSSESDGSFQIDHVIPGSYTLMAWSDDDLNVAVEPELLRAYQKFAVEIVVGPNSKGTARLNAVPFRK